MPIHTYTTMLDWTGNSGSGTIDYRGYSRDFVVTAATKAMTGSADRNFRGDPTRWNPEEMLVASISACHQLWYLHLAADAGLIVTAYSDMAVGTMIEEADGGGHFQKVILHPTVTIAAGNDAALATTLHRKAGHFCFIARSLNFPVECEGTVAFS